MRNGNLSIKRFLAIGIFISALFEIYFAGLFNALTSSPTAPNAAVSPSAPNASVFKLADRPLFVPFSPDANKFRFEVELQNSKRYAFYFLVSYSSHEERSDLVKVIGCGGHCLDKTITPVSTTISILISDVSGQVLSSRTVISSDRDIEWLSKDLPGLGRLLEITRLPAGRLQVTVELIEGRPAFQQFKNYIAVIKERDQP
jgi:hypothetical protein